MKSKHRVLRKDKVDTHGETVLNLIMASFLATKMYLCNTCILSNSCIIACV